MFILKVLKVLYFDTLLQVFILKLVSGPDLVGRGLNVKEREDTSRWGE